jgi:broad specificity phosphatase PhoE
MRIFFARHGESQANLLHEISNRGIPAQQPPQVLARHGLTSKGRAQAGALAGGLEGRKIAQVYSSPLLRAIETSQIVARRLGVGYEISQALCEFDCGILEGRSDEQAWQAWQELWEAWTIRHEWERRIVGVESFRDIQGRFEPFIDDLVQR